MATPIKSTAPTSSTSLQRAVPAPTQKGAAPDQAQESFMYLAQCLKPSIGSFVQMHFPVFNALHDFFTNGNFCARLAQNKESDYLANLLEAMHEFKKTGNSQKIAAFLQELSEIVGMKNDRESFATLVLILAAKKAFETNRLDLFQRPLMSFISPEQLLNQAQKYRIAVSCFQSVGAKIRVFGMCSDADDFAKKMKEIAVLPNSYQIMHLMNCALLASNPFLTKDQKIDICSDFHRLVQQDLETRDTYKKIISLIFIGDIAKNYLPTILNSEQVEEIGVIKSDLSPSERDYVENHCEVYQGFLPRMKEMLDALSQPAAELAQTSRLLKSYHLYLKFGDHQKLIQRLGEKRVSRDEFRKILHEEIASFDERRCAAQIVVYLKQQGMEAVRSIRASQNLAENFFSRLQRLLPLVFDLPMEFASEMERDLYIKPKASKPPSPPPAPDSAPAPAVSVAAKPDDRPQVKKIQPPAKELEEVREKSQAAFKQMAAGCVGFGTPESIKTAQSHLEDLLSTVLRLFEQTQLPLARHHVHAFVVDCVRHGTLAAEQMLSALCRESNRIPNHQQLNKFLSHNLYVILNSCQLKAGPFPPELRKCILGANRGEILVRNLDQCKIDASNVQALLVKTRLFLNGSDAFTSEQILSHTFAFLREISAICQETCRQLDACKQKPANAGEVFAQLNALLQVASKRIANNAVVNRLPCTVEDTSLKSLRENIDNLKKSSQSLEVESGLQNVLNHLLVHLETEMLSHPYLNPIIAHSHCSNVFLYNQMIAQEVLTNLLILKQIPYDLDQEDHDLLPLVEALGMNEKDFTHDEIDFLKRGKATRQMVRYTASYQDKDSHRRTLKAIHDSLELFKKQSFTHHYELEKGFEIGSDNTRSKLEKVKAVVKEDLALLSSIVAKASRFCLA